MFPVLTGNSRFKPHLLDTKCNVTASILSTTFQFLSYTHFLNPTLDITYYGLATPERKRTRFRLKFGKSWEFVTFNYPIGEIIHIYKNHMQNKG